MNELDHLKNLDAHSASAPPIDISTRVLQTLRSPMSLRTSPAATAAEVNAPLWLATVLSWAAAAALLFIAIQSVTTLQDPFSDLFNPLRLVLQ